MVILRMKWWRLNWRRCRMVMNFLLKLRRYWGQWRRLKLGLLRLRLRWWRLLSRLS